MNMKKYLRKGQQQVLQYTKGGGDKGEERPEGWNDEFDVLDRRVKDVNHTFKEVIKKLKKPPVSLKQEVEGATTDTFMITVLKQVNVALETTAEENKAHQSRIEQFVVTDLQALHDKYKDIVADRKKLAQQYVELRTSRDQLNSLYVPLNPSSANGSQPTSTHPTTPAVTETDPTSIKVRDLQSHIEELDTRCASARESYLTKLHNFATSDGERAAVFVKYLNLQRDYYHTLASRMDAYLEGLQTSVAQLQVTSVYSQSLPQHLQTSNRKIAYVLETCVEALLTPHALQQQGLFRLSPSKVKGDYVISRLQLQPYQTEDFLPSADPHSIAYALKHYLRHLPDSLLGTQVTPTQWHSVEEGDSPEKRIDIIRQLVQQLSPESRANTAYLCHFLRRVADYSPHNQMDASNLAIVFAPNLFHSEGPPSVMGQWQMEVAKLLIQHPCDIFSEPVPSCIQKFDAEQREAALSKTEDASAASRKMPPPPPSVAPPPTPTLAPPPLSSSFGVGTGPPAGGDFPETANAPQPQHRRNLSADLRPPEECEASYSPGSGGVSLRPSPSSVARAAPGRPLAGPTPSPNSATLNRQITKKAPPPPPAAVSGVSPSIGFEAITAGIEMRHAPATGEGPSVPTPLPRKNVQSMFVPAAEGSPAAPAVPVPRQRDAQASIAGDQSGTPKPPRPNVPPPIANKPKTSTTSETSKF